MESNLTSLQLTFQPLNKSDNDINPTEPTIIKNRRNTDYDVQGDEDINHIDALWDTAQNNEWYK